jgi:hypothetical protein
MHPLRNWHQEYLSGNLYILVPSPKAKPYSAILQAVVINRPPKKQAPNTVINTLEKTILTNALPKQDAKESLPSCLKGYSWRYVQNALKSDSSSSYSGESGYSSSEEFASISGSD